MEAVILHITVWLKAPEPHRWVPGFHRDGEVNKAVFQRGNTANGKTVLLGGWGGGGAVAGYHARECQKGAGSFKVMPASTPVWR